MGNRQLFPAKSAKELLGDFIESGSQEPFEEIVRRYAAMVYGVCLRVTGDKHDAEDATQAVFLSLALQAKTSREIKYIGPWLQKVAHRLALDVKKAKTRRKKREEKLADEARFNGNGHHNGNGRAFLGGNGDANPADHPGAEELKKIMMEELDKLPAKYRMPLVLHYFGGLSRDEMAAELGCNPSTLGVRVHRGKAMLGTRLAKRGVAMSAIALGVLLEHVVRHHTVQPLVNTSAIASSAVSLMASQSNSVAVVSAQVIALARTAAKAITYAKLKLALVVLLGLGSVILTAGGAIAAYAELNNLRLPIPMDLGKLIRPLLRGIVPSLQASKTDENARDLPASPKSDWDGPSIAMSPGAAPTPASQEPVVIPQGFPRHQTSASAGAATPTPAPELNALAQSILQPPAPQPPPADKPVEPKKTEVAATDAKATEHDTTETIASPEIDLSSPIYAGMSGGDLLLGAGVGGSAGGGRPEVYVLPENFTLRTNNLVIGDAGSAVLRQEGGHNQVAGTMTVGKKKGSVGRYEMNGGTLSAQREVIGDEGEGTFIKTQGVNVAQQSITVGNAAGGQGRYEQLGGETTVVNATPTKDPSKDRNGLHVGEKPGSTGTVVLADGSLTADPQLIGKGGKGSLVQTGGTNQTGAVVVGVDAGSDGQYDMTGGTLVLDTRQDPDAKPQAAIKIGGAGKGRFNFGSADKTGAIYEVNGASSSVVIRGEPSGDGAITGYGPINLTGVFVNNGQVLADGYQRERDLDLSSFTRITSSIENPRWGGTSGWFARREGRLILPPVPVNKGDGSYAWGEDAADPMLDLVNSVRFDITGAKQGGDVKIALYSPLRDDLPELPDGHKFIGIWSFDGSELGGFESVDLEVRYDDALAKELHLDEQILKLWQYDSAQGWQRINDDTFFRNPLDHLLRGRADGDLTYFAVSAPEPGGAVLLLTGAAMALRRRRRR